MRHAEFWGAVRDLPLSSEQLRALELIEDENDRSLIEWCYLLNVKAREISGPGLHLEVKP